MGKLIIFSIPEDQGRTQDELIGVMKMACMAHGVIKFMRSVVN